MIELNLKNIHTSRRRIRRLSQAVGLVVKSYHRKIHTTDSKHDLPVFFNILEREFTAPAPNLVWVSDTTEVRVADHRLFLCTIIDLYSRIVVGHALSRFNDAILVLGALNAAIAYRQPEIGCVFHADRGSTYASHAVRTLLHAKAFVQSMSRRANCWDNAVAESAFARIKSDLGATFETDLLAAITIHEYLTVFHNHIRIHTTIGMAPASFEAMMAAAA